MYFREVVETFRQRYEDIPSKGGKTELIREVVDFIYDDGRRFVKQDTSRGPNCWIPVGREIARDKVSHSFRNKRRLLLVSEKKKTKNAKKIMDATKVIARTLRESGVNDAVDGFTTK